MERELDKIPLCEWSQNKAIYDCFFIALRVDLRRNNWRTMRRALRCPNGFYRWYLWKYEDGWLWNILKFRLAIKNCRPAIEIMSFSHVHTTHTETIYSMTFCGLCAQQLPMLKDQCRRGYTRASVSQASHNSSLNLSISVIERSNPTYQQCNFLITIK